MTPGEKAAASKVLEMLGEGGWKPLWVETDPGSAEDYTREMIGADQPPAESHAFIIDQLDGLDMAYVVFCSDDFPKREGVQFIMGNHPSGSELVADHTCRSKHFMEIMDRYIEWCNGVEEAWELTVG